MIRKRKGRIFLSCLLVSLLGIAGAQDAPQLSAHWLPTDLNNVELSKLTNSTLISASTPQQISGWSILGTVTLSDVATWLSTLQQNPNARTGTVRWNPGVAAKCNSGTVGCTKSIAVTILEFDYTNPNGSDCKATATIAADAILPPVATLITQNGQNYLPTGYPIQYQMTAAPNSTASNCTYILTYPQATQNLANSLCTQGNTSCTTSPCMPCNANQTIFGPSVATNCLPTSGIAPALVAAIEGAAQCLSIGANLGSFQCQVNVTPNNSACSVMHCFPGDATVRMQGGSTKRMRELKIGDKVQVLKSEGTIGYEEIYFFGHRDPYTEAQFVRLSLQSMTGDIVRHLELSSHHFVYVRQSIMAFKAVRAQNVNIKDVLQMMHAGEMLEGEVISIDLVTKEGSWNPYTMGGTIIVNDVIASSHSEWLFDPLFDWIGQTHHLPAFYQVMLAPMRILYRILGKQTMRLLDSHVQFGRLLTSMPAMSKIVS